MKKLIATVVLMCILVGCKEIPKNDNLFVRFINEQGNPISLPIYTVNTPSDYFHYICVEGDAVRVKRKRSDHSIIDVTNVGKNCVQFNAEKPNVSDL